MGIKFIRYHGVHFLNCARGTVSYDSYIMDIRACIRISSQSAPGLGCRRLITSRVPSFNVISLWHGRWMPCTDPQNLAVHQSTRNRTLRGWINGGRGEAPDSTRQRVTDHTDDCHGDSDSEAHDLSRHSLRASQAGQPTRQHCCSDSDWNPRQATIKHGLWRQVLAES